MTDTAKASWITDHAFEPRLQPVAVELEEGPEDQDTVQLPLNPALCQICRMAEAAHSETTVKR